jgi:hypothetical protein
VIKDIFSLVAAIRWDLKRECPPSDRFRMEAAFHLYRFADALRQAIDAAGEVEKMTGYSGKELVEE